MSSISDMEHVKTRVAFGQTLEVYRRNSDIMKMGNVDLSVINYIFWKRQLHSVEIGVSGKENFVLFRKELVERYGGDTQKRPLAGRMGAGDVGAPSARCNRLNFSN